MRLNLTRVHRWWRDVGVAIRQHILNLDDFHDNIPNFHHMPWPLSFLLYKRRSNLSASQASKPFCSCGVSTTYKIIYNSNFVLILIYMCYKHYLEYNYMHEFSSYLDSFLFSLVINQIKIFLVRTWHVLFVCIFFNVIV